MRYILHLNTCIQILELNYIDQVIPNKNTGISEDDDFMHCVYFVLPLFIDFLRQSFHHSVLFSCIVHVCTCCYIKFKFFIKTSKSTRQFHSRQKIYYLMICVESFIYSSNLSAKFIQSTSDLIIQKTCHFSSGQISQLNQLLLQLSISLCQLFYLYLQKKKTGNSGWNKFLAVFWSSQKLYRIHIKVNYNCMIQHDMNSVIHVYRQLFPLTIKLY